MTYNMTALQQADTIYKIVVYANDSTAGALIGLFLIASFFIMMMALKKYDFPKALLASSTITFVVSLFFVYAKLINPIWSLAFLIIAAGSALLSTMFE